MVWRVLAVIMSLIPLIGDLAMDKELFEQEETDPAGLLVNGDDSI